MMRAFCKWCMKMMGWSYVMTVPDLDKSVICVAPHTSNWDFILGKVFYTAAGRNANFLIKKEWFTFPFNLIIGPLGGIPVDRGRSTSLVDQLVKISQEKEKFNIAITPEGTRKRSPRWKRGFYYLALKGNMPIVLTAFDYKNKKVYMTEVFYPTGNEDEDMKKIQQYFVSNSNAKYPKLFATSLD